MKISVQELLSSQHWYLASMDGINAGYSEMDEASFNASSFLDNRMVTPPSGRKFKASIQAITSAAPWAATPPSVPHRFILHISHVGSTLLARIAGVSPTCLSLREPVALRFLAQQLQDQGTAEAWQSPQAFSALLDFALRNLGRPLGERTRVMVKCTSWVNPLARHFLAADVAEPKRVMGVHVPLENFAANTLKSSGGLQDLRANAQSRMRRLRHLVPSFDRKLYNMNWGQIAAMSWLCEILTIRQVCDQPNVQLKWLNFDEFMRSPQEQARDLAQHLDLEWDEQTDSLLASSGVLGKYSKANKAVDFTNDERMRALDKFKQDNQTLIASAKTWAQEVIAGYPELDSWLGSAEHVPTL
jgi:hypothetical protein